MSDLNLGAHEQQSMPQLLQHKQKDRKIMEGEGGCPAGCSDPHRWRFPSVFNDRKCQRKSFHSLLCHLRLLEIFSPLLMAAFTDLDLNNTASKR